MTYLLEPQKPDLDTATWSIRTPLRQRTACPACGHLHRVVVARACDCCKEDIVEAYRHTIVPTRGGKVCKVCGRGIIEDEAGKPKHVADYHADQ